MARWGLTEVTAPASEPLTIAEVKEHLRIDGSSEDLLVGNLIVAARQQIEHELERALVTQTWDLFLDEFPGGGRQPLYLPKPPLSSVTTVKYYDSDNTLQTLSSANYIVDATSQPGRIIPVINQSWPATRDRQKAVEIRFVAGYGASVAVPAIVRQALLMLIGAWYCDRDQSGMMPDGIHRMLDVERWNWNTPYHAGAYA